MAKYRILNWKRKEMKRSGQKLPLAEIQESLATEPKMERPFPLSSTTAAIIEPPFSESLPTEALTEPSFSEPLRSEAIVKPPLASTQDTWGLIPKMENYSNESPTPLSKTSRSKKSKPRRRGWLVACLLLAVLVIGSFITNSSINKVKAGYDKEISILNAKIDYLLQAAGTDAENKQESLSYASPLSAASSVLGQGVSSLDLMNQEVVEIVRSAGPSVVGIRVSAPSQQVSFWGWQQLGTQMSEGSGIIYNQEGYILTNYHVMSAAVGQPDAVIEVFLADGRTASGAYVAGDEQNDIAILKIEMSGLTPANFGTSATVVPGEFAMAIGNPLGMTYAGSITVGIISGVNRIVEAENVADSMLQTNAAINPGNSGGALINGRGQVIGMNTIKLASAELEGLGFAIPIDYVRPIADSLIKYGYVRDRPYTGITGSEISPMTARFYRVPAGLLVSELQRDSAAALAGVQQGDIVTEMDGREVNSMSDINNILKKHKVGDEISLQIYRNGYQYDLLLTLQELK